jgi:citronellol/citronellal dehydrogenase
MSLCVIGIAAEFESRIAVNALWPKFFIETAANESIL